MTQLDSTFPISAFTRLRVRDLEAAAALRKPGYVDAVKRAAREVTADWVTIRTAALEAIQAEFGGPLDSSGCCGD